MNKLKRKMLTIILGSLLSIMNCLPVFAAESGISPHYEATPCFVCFKGNVHTDRTETNFCKELIDGIWYESFDVTITTECDTCDYKVSESYREHRHL